MIPLCTRVHCVYINTGNIASVDSYACTCIPKKNQKLKNKINISKNAYNNNITYYKGM